MEERDSTIIAIGNGWIVMYILLGFVFGLVVRFAYDLAAFKKLDCLNMTSNGEEYVPPKPNTVPRHIGVIMDGNRRYGRQQHADPLKGHWAGGQTLVDFVQWCMQDGVEILTVYAFSTENWSREPLEVQTLMTIFAKYAESFKHEALTRNVRVRVISTDFDRLPTNVIQSVHELESATAHCTGFHLNICLSYGGRAEIVNACKTIAKSVHDGSMLLEDISENSFNNYLCTKGLPDPDVLIRTSGEYRLSNFLCWQLAYTELFFVDSFWPQLKQSDLRNIMIQFSDRKRRFGK